MKLVKATAEERDVPRGVVGGAEISQATTGAHNIYMGIFRVPAGSRGRPHYHDACESALFMLSGSIEIQVAVLGDEATDQSQWQEFSQLAEQVSHRYAEDPVPPPPRLSTRPCSPPPGSGRR